MTGKIPAEGDIFKTIAVGGHTFTIRYGYYTDSEREVMGPIPIYPCFIRQPLYTQDGFPLITVFQDACEHYIPTDGTEGDAWCADCMHCSREQEAIGICQCSHRRNHVSNDVRQY